MFEQDLGSEAANKFRLFVDVMEAMGQPVKYRWLDVDGVQRLVIAPHDALRFARWVDTEHSKRVAGQWETFAGMAQRAKVDPEYKAAILDHAASQGPEAVRRVEEMLHAWE